MRILLLVVWLLIPVGALAYHLGPGQDQMKLDEASQLLADADSKAADKEWAKANSTYGDALSKLPASRIDAQRRVRLERAKAQMQAEQLPEAHKDLMNLVDDLESDVASGVDIDPALLEDARGTLANAQYYITWLMRIEGLSREQWQNDILNSQQNYRLLALEAKEAGDEVAYVSYIEDLESSVRLARMDLGELAGLPLPNQ